MNFQFLAQQYAINPVFTGMVSVPAGPVDRVGIKNILLTNGKLLNILQPTGIPNQISQTVAFLLTDLDYKTTIDLNAPQTQSLISGLYNIGEIDQNDINDVMTLATIQIPRWQYLGFSTCPQQGDINYALQLYSGAN